jgi:hypothetical protein
MGPCQLRDIATAQRGLVLAGGCRHLAKSRIHLGCCRRHPPCWPQHPHLVHEIAVLADQRRRAGLAPTSDALDEWHRYSLPSFTERMKTRLRNHCHEDHQSWPAKGRHTRHIAEASRHRRMHAYAADLGGLKSLHPQTQSPRLGVVDLDTGEIKDL